MKKLLLLLLCVPLLYSCAENKEENQKDKDINVDDFKDPYLEGCDLENPIDVINILFHVAETKDFKLLNLICNLEGIEAIKEGSSKNCDVCGICPLANHNKSEAGHNSSSRDEFVDMFKGGYIDSLFKFSYMGEIRLAEVPVVLFINNKMFNYRIILFQDSESNRWYFGDF